MDLDGFAFLLQEFYRIVEAVLAHDSGSIRRSNSAMPPLQPFSRTLLDFDNSEMSIHASQSGNRTSFKFSPLIIHHFGEMGRISMSTFTPSSQTSASAPTS